MVLGHTLDNKDKFYYFRDITDKVYLLFLAIHFSFIFLFFITGVEELVVFNFVSSLVYIFALYLNNIQKYNIAFALLSLEVIAHAYLCSQYIGDAGFTEALLFLPMLFFIHPVHTRAKFGYFAGIVCVYMALLYNDQFHDPQYILDIFLLRFFNIGTALLVLLISSYIAHVIYRAILGKEEQLFEENKKLENQYKIVEKLSITDGLTNLYNRHKIEDILIHEIKRCDRTGEVFSLIVIDIDHFKQVNDNYGHFVGDEVLRSFASILQESIRETDVVGRWGGEEFIILCIDTDIEGTKELAEKIRETVDSHKFDYVDHKTASFGIAAFEPGMTTDSLFVKADKALYQAKETGRNKVVVAEE